MESLIVWFFKQLAFLVNTEPEPREDDGAIKRLPAYTDAEGELIMKRERIAHELLDTLTSRTKRGELSKQFAACSDKLFMLEFQIGEIRKLVNNQSIGDAELCEQIVLILDMKKEDVPRRLR